MRYLFVCINQIYLLKLIKKIIEIETYMKLSE